MIYLDEADQRIALLGLILCLRWLESLGEFLYDVDELARDDVGLDDITVGLGL